MPGHCQDKLKRDSDDLEQIVTMFAAKYNYYLSLPLPQKMNICLLIWLCYL